MYPVQHLVPNGFTINVVRLSARQSPGLYGPCSTNLSASPRGFYQPCIQYLGVSPRSFYHLCSQNISVCPRRFLPVHWSKPRCQFPGFYQLCSQNLSVVLPGLYQSCIQYLIQSPMVLLFRTWVLIPAGFISPVIRASLQSSRLLQALQSEPRCQLPGFFQPCSPHFSVSSRELYQP